MTPQSGKAKGRRLQQWLIKKVIDVLNIHPEDIENRSMGAGGEDIIMSRAARSAFPFSVEAKNVEKLNVWKAYEQAEANSGAYEPLLIMKKNHKHPVIVIDAEYFVGMCREIQRAKNPTSNLEAARGQSLIEVSQNAEG